MTEQELQEILALLEQQDSYRELMREVRAEELREARA